MNRLVQVKGSLLALVAGASLFVAAGCYEEQPYPPPPYGMAYYDYYYYPDEEVYFYPETGVYFWFDGGVWHRGRHLPRGVVVHDTARVNVRINSRTPYEHHEEIRARYPAHPPVPPPATPEPRREALPERLGR